MESVLEALPKDIIICDWQYGAPGEDETWPTMLHFKNQGFQVLASPWNQVDNITSLGEIVWEMGWDIPIKQYKNSGIHEWQVLPDIYP